MNEELLEKLTEMQKAREPFVVATVIRVEGSTSAKPGAKAIIDKNGKTLIGWVGGGCAESAVSQEALACLEDEQTRIVPIDLDDEVLGVGMPCGGMMEVYVEPYLPKPELLIVGHGRIAESLAMLGKFLDFVVTVNDPLADKNTFPWADRLITDDQDFSQLLVGPDTYVVIATQHKGDHFSIKKALQGKGAYIALVASKKRSALVLKYLLETGISQEELTKVQAPAGIDIGCITPEEIALSIISEIIARRRGGSGLPMMEIKGMRISVTPQKEGNPPTKTAEEVTE